MASTLATNASANRMQAADFIGDVHAVAVGQMPQFGDLAFELGDGFFEIEKVHNHLYRTGLTLLG